MQRLYRRKPFTGEKCVGKVIAEADSSRQEGVLVQSRRTWRKGLYRDNLYLPSSHFEELAFTNCCHIRQYD
jgi:hypothetical protein